MFRVLAFCGIWIPAFVFAQGGGSTSAEQNLDYYFALYSQADGKLAPSIDPLKELLLRLDQKRPTFNSRKAFLHHVFVKTNNTFLKKYSSDASFNEQMTTGLYNCLSATALYQLILAYYGFEADLIETNYHIFLIVRTEGGPVLIETTAGNEGFIDNPLEMQRRIDTYREQKPQKVVTSAKQYDYSTNYLDSVSTVAVLGLMHYNHAVRAFNTQKFGNAISHLHHALLLHRSPKMVEFLHLLEQTVRQSKMVTDIQRQHYIDRIQLMAERNKVISRKDP